MRVKAQDRIGQRFGKLVVTGIFYRNRTVKEKVKLEAWATLQCDCGNLKETMLMSLTSGRIVSCWCGRKGKAAPHLKTHGMSKTKTYKTWVGIISRCYNPKSTNFEYWGERGIEVCDRWHKFENFLEDMGEIPIKMSIDRINNNGNYEKSNCRIVNNKTQSRNKSTNLVFEYKGQTLCLAELCEIHNVNYKMVHSRIRYKKWDIKTAMETPAKSQACILPPK